MVLNNTGAHTQLTPDGKPRSPIREPWGWLHKFGVHPHTWGSHPAGMRYDFVKQGVFSWDNKREVIKMGGGDIAAHSQKSVVSKWVSYLRGAIVWFFELASSQ